MSYTRFFLLSIVMHVFILTLFFYHQHQFNLSQHGPRIVRAYLFQAPRSQVVNIKQQKKTQQKRELKKRVLIKNLVTQHHVIKLENKQRLELKPVSQKRAIQTPKPLSVGEHNRLLSKIHDIVLRHLIYPKKAVFLNATGTVLLRFVLMPTGQVQQIRILKSSGYSFLDKAAQSTLKRVSPLPFANRYLTQAEKFSLPVTFEIAS